MCGVFIDAKCQKRKRMQRVPEGFSSTCVSSCHPCAQQGAGIPSPFLSWEDSHWPGTAEAFPGEPCTAPLWHILLFPGGIQPLSQRPDQVTAEGLGSQTVADCSTAFACIHGTCNIMQHVFSSSHS